MRAGGGQPAFRRCLRAMKANDIARFSMAATATTSPISDRGAAYIPTIPATATTSSSNTRIRIGCSSAHFNTLAC